MKKILFIIILLNSVLIQAQHKIAEKVSELQGLHADFVPVSVLVPNPNTVNHDVNLVVGGATLATLKIDGISSILAHRYDYMELQIPYQDQNISVLLYQVNPFSEGFHLDTDRTQNITYQKGVYYRGIIKGQPNSVASFNFFNGECNGVISSAALGNLVVGKLDKRGNTTDYIVYSDTNMKVMNQFDCHAKEKGFEFKNADGNNRKSLTDRCVAVYFEIDNNLFVANNSDVTATTNWMTSVFNNIKTLYANDGIAVGLKSLFIWTTPDPYEGTGKASQDYLIAFNKQRPYFDGDVGQLVGTDDNGAYGGIAASIGGLCTEYNFSYADLQSINYNAVPTYSWTINLIAHELGHLLGSPHTHGCYWNGDNTAIDGCGQQAGYPEGSCVQGPIPTSEVKGTIMSYCHLISGVGVNLSNGFGTQPAAAILSTVNGSNCLSFDCINTCINFVSALKIDSITTDTLSFSWTDSGSTTSWQVSVAPFQATSVVWNTVTTKSYSVSGLNPNSYYKIRVRPYCQNIESSIKEKIAITPATDYCAGVLFTDTGGLNANYTDMENYTRTMIPSDSSLKTKVTFNAFDLEKDYDYLYIYNGATEAADNLTVGGLTGNTLPDSYTSTAVDGSLTFKFTSDEATVAKGWDATITCTQASLGINDNHFIDYSYYPNPTNGKVMIASKDTITQVAVYNLEGQLLFSKKANEVTTNVDLSQFANGTYFFKLKFEDKEANFKVLKR